jgi:SAM-dependent methyltransferase
MELHYQLASDGIHSPPVPVQHRDDEYAQSGFTGLLAMQSKHFWYPGRHRFLLTALDRYVAPLRAPISAVDLGGGVGGWLRYLCDRRPGLFQLVALADSSRLALRSAQSVLPPRVERFHVDLMALGWRQRWDVAFLLDVLEHLPDDLGALSQVREALKPGGLLFVTTPALPLFWSYNDDLAHHLRRYTRHDFARLAREADLELRDARYFMFFLSPLYWLARRGPGIGAMTEEKQRHLARRAHRVPNRLVNGALTAMFASESPLGHRLRFPWGTSLLGVFRRPL